MPNDQTDKNILIESSRKNEVDDSTIIPQKKSGEEATPSKPQYEPPYLVVVEGPRTGARFPLGKGPNVIGRSQGNAVRLEDQSVSRQHAEIEEQSSGWAVKDLGSKNGTFVNGKLISETVFIGHKDIIKTGIYFLRLITQPVRLEEEMTLPAELVMADRTIFVAAPPDGLTAALRKKDVPEPEEAPAPSRAPSEGGRKIPELKEDQVHFKLSKIQLIKIAGIAVAGICVMTAVAYFAFQSAFKSYKKVAAPSEIASPEAVPEGELPQLQEMPGAMEEEDVPPPEEVPPPVDDTAAPPTTAAQEQPEMTVQPTPKTPMEGPVTTPPAPPQPQPAASVQTIPVFLDIASSPMPAKVSFRGQEIGQTPMRINVQLEPGGLYQMEALFVMADIGQSHRQTIDFTAHRDKSVIPILFRAPIGILKVNDLPRDVQFYLEGKYSYDRFQEQTVKLTQIVLQKPIYAPFGSYFLELRRTRQMGATSQTFVTDIVFRRDFVIAEDSPTYTLEVKDEDLKIFPARIKSNPPNASVFIDGQLMGKTPYEGNFPIGEHKLALRKEGYFEHSEDLDIDINTPFVADIKLKTSVAGSHINNAKLAMSRNMYQDAVNELAEALNSQPTPSEIGFANYLLGRCYLNLGDIQRGMEYFEKARADETQKYSAMLGLASGYAMLSQLDKALPLIVEVMLKNKDEETKREAHDLFQKVSPFRSVIYVYSDPAGAKVIVNDKPVDQPTPVILHELPLGSYRIHIEKPGYLPTDLNLSLSVNEFNPVIVKLKPVPQ